MAVLEVTLARPDRAAAPDDLPVAETGDANALRRAGAELTRRLDRPEATVQRSGLSGSRLTAFVEGLVLGAYRFSYRTDTDPATVPRRVELAGPTDAEAVARGLRNAAATVWARDLINTPAAVKTPAWLAEQAHRVLTPLGVQVAVRDEAGLAAEGFGGLLAVGGGSASGPRLIQASWRPAGARRSGPHVVLVGKGITFDTGGINLKPGSSLRTMHTDMSGAAATLAALRVVAQQRLPLRVTVLAPCAENALGAAAYRPGDVVRHYGGRTTEINNTDAEGRIVLADAMAYAVARLRPTVLIDIATLTGAMKVALGVRTGGVFATTPGLSAALRRAGERTGEPLWELPLLADYETATHSDIADALQAPGSPGAITAALFLRPFAGSVPWAHLDIAGPARAERAGGIAARGGTGFGARLLAAWLETLV